ncbi:MAG: von Willebrand factor type A domain-containing protein [candidate division Zixibacteria bacterium]|nr:von Willebrand factor type A domain-containing protein [candidate division Zixibacteria bacterium]
MHSTRKTVVMILLIPVLLIANALLYAAATGKITGTITDKATGQPMIGVSIIVVGTDRGAMTDFDGKYVIPQLEPGTYTLRISSVNFTTIEVIDIIVRADITIVVSQSMEESTTGLDKVITVKGRQDQLQIHDTATKQTITKEEVARKPVTTVDELLTQSSGDMTNSKGEVFIRGGRAGEVSYIVNGVPLNNPQGGLEPAGDQAGCVLGSPKIMISPSTQTPRRKREVRCPSPPIRPPYPDEYIPPVPDAMYFQDYGVNNFTDTRVDHLSTFAIDVDDASYVMTRSYLERGQLPPSEAVRVEEFVNRFDYNYDAPRHDAFRVHLEGAPSRFGPGTQLLKIGIKGLDFFEEERQPANLVFVVDVSGSMGKENRIGLVRRSLLMLLNELDSQDQVGIVEYGTGGRIVLEPTSVRDKRQIEQAIMLLTPGGSTNAEAGLRLGYKMAKRHLDPNRINRVILCSDGVANVGRTTADELLKKARRCADLGITLTTIGFGMGNYNDVLMEQLGDKGNGNYAYVDGLDEAKRVMVENLTGMLQVIARDVKIQVDFDQRVVRSYRLLGYENRDVADHKFRDDKEDGGEIGAGHEVTALYEIQLTGKRHRGNIGTVHIRYKQPDITNVSQARAAEVTCPIPVRILGSDFNRATRGFKLAAAAAEFAEILRGSHWSQGSDLYDVLALVEEISRGNRCQEINELRNLVSMAANSDQQLAEW